MRAPRASSQLARACGLLALITSGGIYAAAPGEAVREPGAEPGLQLAEALAHAGPVPAEAERELLRVEYRLRLAINAQGAAALELAARLRDMEAAVQALATASGAPPAAAPASVAQAPLPASAAPAPGEEAGDHGAAWRIAAGAVAALALAGLLLVLRRRRAGVSRAEQGGEKAEAPRPSQRPLAVPGAPPAAAPGLGAHKGDGPLDQPTHSLDFSLAPSEYRKPAPPAD